MERCLNTSEVLTDGSLEAGLQQREQSQSKQEKKLLQTPENSLSLLEHYHRAFNLKETPTSHSEYKSLHGTNSTLFRG